MAIRSAPTDRATPEPLTVVVGAMRRRHLRGVLRIEHRVYPKPWSLGLFISELGQRSTRVYLVARVQRRVVGYLGMFHTADEAHVTTIAVDPDWHRRGIGSRLLGAAARAARARGCHNLTLEVRVSNEGAQALYRRFGFVPAGIRAGYYPDNREDALIMWATDIDTSAYAERLAQIERDIPGDTVIEDGRL
jgi:[ribosomal protein S18]-alanine N-acetyltransferase